MPYVHSKRYALLLPPCSLLTHPNYKIYWSLWAANVITNLSLCLGIQPSAEQFTSALIATASTARLNGVHDQEIWGQAFNIHLPTASQISCSITMSLGKRGKPLNACNVQSHNSKANRIFLRLVFVQLCPQALFRAHRMWIQVLYVICRDGTMLSHKCVSEILSKMCACASTLRDAVYSFFFFFWWQECMTASKAVGKKIANGWAETAPRLYSGQLGSCLVLC